MIRIDFDPARLSGTQAEFWTHWRVRAEQATLALRERIARGEAASFDPGIWAEFKSWMFEEVFAGKCAYCEGRVRPQSFGDAEHWRPKAGVTVRHGSKLEPVVRRNERHPGYWWTAYEPSNLLPSCQRCNSGKGKRTQFPVAREHCFSPEEGLTPDELDAQEEPLLLHPLRGSDPAGHLHFDEFGHVRAVDGSRQGQVSIEVFDLNRGNLTEDRLARLQEADDALRDALVRVAYTDVNFEEAVATWTRPEAPYSLAVQQHYARGLEKYIERLRH